MIEAISLTKRFDENIALNAVNFTIPTGAIYGLVGSNGSGKSTLMRLISGVYTPDKGEISVDGQRPFNNPALKGDICFLPDTPYFIHQSNIKEMARFYSNIYPGFSKERFDYLSGIFPLSQTARIHTMSKGMQRQAALMLSLARSPKYLLLDEAFDGLDPVMRRILKSLLADGALQGMTTIIASHNLRDLEDLCDRVGVLHKGDVIVNDSVDSMKSNIHKVQLAFSAVPETAVFESLDVLKTERTGSLLQMVVRGDKAELEAFFKKLFPLFCEWIEPTFEEIFMYELEENGYDAENLLK